MATRGGFAFRKVSVLTLCFIADLGGAQKHALYAGSVIKDASQLKLELQVGK